MADYQERGDAIATGHLAGRLRAARETAGLSTRSVARRIQELGVKASHTTVSNCELGKTLPSMSLLRAIAHIYERSPSWLLGQGPLLEGLRYRCLKSVRVSDKKRFEGQALGWLQAYLHVERALCRERTKPSFHVRGDESGKEVAQRIRGKFNLGSFPIPSVIRISENFGIRVIHVDSEARIDGFAARLGDVSVAALNSRLSNDRIRLNAAHELAHHLYQDCVRRDEMSEDMIEQRAFECASHLLIPDEQLEAAFELKSMVRLVQYKERFGISLAAMIYRARESQLIPSRLYERLWRDFSRLGWRKVEPGYVSPDRPVRMEAFFDAAVREKKLTLAEIAQVAGVDEYQVRQRILHAMGGGIEDTEQRSSPSTLTLADNHESF